jgi:2-(1,2-epoxy-1,2-dihydrophenyl)acetyl-CoA isomerase
MTLESRSHGNVRVDLAGDTGHVVLDRADRDNALDLTTATALRDALKDAIATSGVRAIVIRAEGRRFSVGGDLLGFRAAPVGANLCDAVARPINDCVEMMHAARQPVICAVHGAVGGGANGVVLAADVVIATSSTIFRLGYTGSGLTPDCGVTWHLPHRVGFARAMDLALTNRRVTAGEACDWGIVSRIVPDDGLAGAIDEVLDTLRRVPTETLSETKRLLRRAISIDLHAQLDDEARTIGRIGDTADTREAIAAFLDKRAPNFSA